MACAGASVGRGGGTPENILLIISAGNRDSMYVGNYYKHARNIPDANVLYIDPLAPDFPTFADVNLDEVFGTLANRRISDHIDYVVVSPAWYYIDVGVPGLVSDGCSPVTRFSISGAYTMAFIADEVLAGGLTSQATNHYYRNGVSLYGFDSSTGWLSGLPDNSPSAKRYFIGATLGHLGNRGNTVQELLAMIDRSVASDGSRPAGSYYFMQTTDFARSTPRHGAYPAVVSQIESYGGAAEHLMDVLPLGRHDCMGIMTGWAAPGIDGADLSIINGAFCDHLTSWAATFDISTQEKVSRWIAKGASGSWGTVEEPCNYAGKFPHARTHLFHYRGLSLGESVFRSVGFVPFQGLLYGDPMTRPFTYIPVVAVPDAPGGSVAGVITLTPEATTDNPLADMDFCELLIDGALHSSTSVGGAFSVDTAELSDGYHDVRVLAYDDSNARSVGRWLGSITVNNTGRAASLSASPGAGDFDTSFSFNVAGTGGAIQEVRVVQNGKVLTAAAGSSAVLAVYGATLGAGPVTVQGEALLSDGQVVRSAPVELLVDYSGGTTRAPPAAFNFTKRVLPDEPFVVELPHTFDSPTAALTFEVLSNPAKATVASGQSGPFRLMRPEPAACGTDSFTFRVNSNLGPSNVATVTLVYDYNPCDVNCDGSVNAFDIQSFVELLSPAPPTPCSPCAGDANQDGSTNAFDIENFVNCLGG